ncbi:uncharacterized protein N7484_002364 [Penicillium longicatenatum]|uniref:uncharacterized protein n=1 Tax=Penicillium longicatenatum TaxID=1561947 RepID=UPI0025499214|nr:uncharacterized protein N7484_002364 [Penicillium longicatenatum]KAJ5658715.1 hypothetical protein N7484_002364 [Penicillium longicatenatum]
MRDPSPSTKPPSVLLRYEDSEYKCLSTTDPQDGCSLPSYFLKIEPKLATSELSMAAQAFAIFTVTRNLGNVANSEQHANDVGNSGARIVHSFING